MAEIVVHLDGGLVQWVYKRGRGEITGCVIVDCDTEGADEDELTVTTNDKGETIDAVVHDEGFVSLKPGCEIDRLVDAYDKKITGRS
jgi:hypothetical protein